MPDILAIGEPMVELNRHRGSEHYAVSCGGDVSNAMVAAARSGASTGIATAVGDDEFGRMLRAMWAREGVDAACVRTDPAAPTGIYFVSHTEAGHDFSYRRAGSAASLYGPGDLPLETLRGAGILHVSGISQAISARAADAVFAAMGLAREAGVLLSYDANVRLKLWPIARARAVIHEAMADIDIALPGLDDARLLVGVEDPDAIADRYLSLGARIVALKLGGQGCLLATPERRERWGPYPVTAVDATGAGDTFDGAFLARYLETRDPFAAARYANVAAALATRGYGAVDPMPRRADVLAALAGSTSAPQAAAS